MRCVDVNILVYAFRPESPRHEDHRQWLDQARMGREPLGLIDGVAVGFVRVVTNRRVFRQPATLDEALAFVEVLRASPAVVPVSSGDRHWALFVELCRSAGAAGNLVAHAHLAAVSQEQNATWVSADLDFARFPGLRWVQPLDS
jgi:uncharacterized protein